MKKQLKQFYFTLFIVFFTSILFTQETPGSNRKKTVQKPPKKPVVQSVPANKKSKKGILNSQPHNASDSIEVSSQMNAPEVDKRKESKRSALTQKDETKEGWLEKNWLALLACVISLINAWYTILQHRKRKEITEELKRIDLKTELVVKQEIKLDEKEAEYRDALEQKLDKIHMTGVAEHQSDPVKMDHLFVSLRMSRLSRSQEPSAHDIKNIDHDCDNHLCPEDVIEQAYKRRRMLLIVGDAGFGKTTLLKYYALNCLNKSSKKNKQSGLNENVFPVFFPLKEVQFDHRKGAPHPLPKNLEKWAGKLGISMSEDMFQSLLKDRESLFLLDGLDEVHQGISQQICRWIQDMCLDDDYKNAKFIVTTRPSSCLEFFNGKVDSKFYFRTDIMNFSDSQQEEFLKKWFNAVYLPGENSSYSKNQIEKQEMTANQKAGSLISLLENEDHKSVRELTRVPMLLHLLAIIWEGWEFKSETRNELYYSALNYLLEGRDREKKLRVIVTAKEARRILEPTALWMHEEFNNDEVPASRLENYIEDNFNIDTLSGHLSAKDFLISLRERSGLLGVSGKGNYFFRHKPFQDYLAGQHTAKGPERNDLIAKLVDNFKENRWEGVLFFFISESDEHNFDTFMELFFQSDVSKNLAEHQQALLLDVVSQAPQRPIDALSQFLKNNRLDDQQKQSVLACLHEVASPEAYKIIDNSYEKGLSLNNSTYVEILEKKNVRDAVDKLKKKDFKAAKLSIDQAIRLRHSKIRNRSLKVRILIGGFVHNKVFKILKQMRRYLSRVRRKNTDLRG